MDEVDRADVGRESNNRMICGDGDGDDDLVCDKRVDGSKDTDPNVGDGENDWGDMKDEDGERVG